MTDESADPMSNAARVDALNNECFCISLDEDALARTLATQLGDATLAELVGSRCPHAFATRPVFLSGTTVARMREVVQAVESVVALPAYREEVLAGAPAIAHHEPGARGVFYGYDFHADAGRLGLIEINTNAGGAMLNVTLSRAQRACCAPVERLLPPASQAKVMEQRIVGMFHEEWRLAGRTTRLRRIAIVDERPQEQYLYPEFLLFKRLFERHGLQAFIADPSELAWRHGQLHCADAPIDLIYNRLTDFTLDMPAHAALREAYLQNAVVLTPHPRAHALYADKRNLAFLTDPQRLHALGVPPSTQEVLLTGIPRTEVLNPAHAERLWNDRRRLFFKPTAGWGGRAAYRGDKLTRRVWESVLQADYVAQDIVAPGQRAMGGPGDGIQSLKFDLRNYAYQGQVQWVAARLYQGQTTNFRTPGGGFAPVYALPSEGGASQQPDDGGAPSTPSCESAACSPTRARVEGQ